MINTNEYEVTLRFENEHLLKHGKMDYIYRVFRSLRYGGVTGIECFKIILENGKPVKL
jgi:hypothetical protein